MVNYKVVNEGQTIPVESLITGRFMGYVEFGGDILETKTNQLVMRGLGMRKAKELVRHLNFGGGFDGFTPAFFLAGSAKFNDSSE